MCSKDLKLEPPNWLVRNENTSHGLMKSTKHPLLYSLQLGSGAASDLANIWQEGAVPCQREGAASPARSGSDNVGGHCRIPPRCPSTTEAIGLSWSTHKVWRRQHSLWKVTCTPPPASDQVPSAHLGPLYFTGRRTLLPMHRSLGTDGGCRSLATQVTRLWFPPP